MLNRILCGLIVVASLGTHAVNADLVVESFSYPGQANVAGQNGGTGFLTPWTATLGDAGLIPTSLSFGSFSTSGGAATVNLANQVLLNRFLATPFQSGNEKGVASFLFQFNKFADTPIGIFTFGLRGSGGNIYINDNSALSATIAPITQIIYSGIPSVSASSNQSIFSFNTTYMQLVAFDVTPLARTASTWIITSDQYESLAQGGLTVDELNSRTLGQGANNVLQRLSITGHGLSTIESINFGNGAASANGPMFTVDEIRVSNTNFNTLLGITAVPEPSSTLLVCTSALGAVWTSVKRARRSKATSGTLSKT